MKACRVGWRNKNKVNRMRDFYFKMLYVYLTKCRTQKSFFVIFRPTGARTTKSKQLLLNNSSFLFSFVILLHLKGWDLMKNMWNMHPVSLPNWSRRMYAFNEEQTHTPNCQVRCSSQKTRRGPHKASVMSKYTNSLKQESLFLSSLIISAAFRSRCISEEPMTYNYALSHPVREGINKRILLIWS